MKILGLLFVTFFISNQNIEAAEKNISHENRGAEVTAGAAGAAAGGCFLLSATSAALTRGQSNLRAACMTGAIVGGVMGLGSGARSEEILSEDSLKQDSEQSLSPQEE